MPDKVYPPELRALLERAMHGDASVLPEVMRAFDAHPDLAALLGDLTDQVERQLLGLMAGTCLAGQEANRRQLAAVRAALVALATNELERLLAIEISLDWLALQHARMDLGYHLKPSAVPSGTQPAARRLDRAHARYLAASKMFAIVQALLRRAPSPLDLLRPTGEMAAAGRGRKATRGGRAEVQAAFS